MPTRARSRRTPQVRDSSIGNRANIANAHVHICERTSINIYIDGHRGSHSSTPKAFRGERLPPLSQKSDTLPGKIVIEKRRKTEFILPLLGLFGENTLPSTPKIHTPSLPRLVHSPPPTSWSASDRAHVCI